MTTTGQNDTNAFRQEVEECAAFLAAHDSCLANLLAQSAELHEAARALVDEANANGGRDNVSVALCRFTGPAKKTGFLSKLQRK